MIRLLAPVELVFGSCPGVDRTGHLSEKLLVCTLSDIYLKHINYIVYQHAYKQGPWS